MNRKNKLPKFNSVREEQVFWNSTDTADLVDWTKATSLKFPNLKPTVKSISIRLPQIMIDDLKVLANRRDIPYQSLMKTYLSERIQKDLNSKSESH
jgi:predicted DNA binding CopG/RHH family protein